MGSKIYGGFPKKVGIIDIVKSKGDVRKVFETQHAPTITVTNDGHIISFDCTNRISKHTISGVFVSASDTVYNDCYDISECPLNNRIVIACHENGVVVLDKSLTKIFEYKGQDKTAKVEEFRSYSAVFDGQGDILVGDYFNKCIHVVCGDSGQCLQVLDTEGLSCPREIRLFQNMLWVRCEHPDRIICIEVV